MENVIYIYDAGTGDLLITTVMGEGDEPQDANAYEGAVETAAKKYGMHLSDCSWGGVGTIMMDAAVMMKASD